MEKADRFKEVEQAWYCTAKHLHSLLEDAKAGRKADYGLPCSDCKYNLSPFKCNTSLAYARFEVLGNVTGISYTPIKGG